MFYKVILPAIVALFLGALFYILPSNFVLFLIAGVAGAAFLFFNSKIGIGLLAVAALFPFYRQIGPAIVPLVDVLLLSVFVPWLLITALYSKMIQIPKILGSIIFMLVVFAGTVFIAHDKATTIKEILQLVLFAIIYTLTIYNNISSISIVKKMMGFLSVGVALLGGLAVIQFLQTRSVIGIYVLGLHKNALGGLMSLAFPYVLMKVFTSEKKLGWIIIAVFNGLGLMVSLSRGAWLGAFVGVLIISAFLGKKYFRTVFLAVCILWLAFVFFIPSNFKEAATSIKTLSDRQVYWQIATSGFLKNPIYGWGYANYKYAAYEYLGIRKGNLFLSIDPHNMLYRFAVETGVVGLSAFFVFSLVLFRRGYIAIGVARNKTEKWYLLVGIYGGLWAYYVHGLFDVFWTRGAGSLFWIYVGLISVLAERKLSSK